MLKMEPDANMVTGEFVSDIKVTVEKLNRTVTNNYFEDLCHEYVPAVRPGSTV